jgi:hypothetical protein
VVDLILTPTVLAGGIRSLATAPCNMQHATCNGHDAICNVHRAPRNVHRATCNIAAVQLATCNVQHATSALTEPMFTPTAVAAWCNPAASARYCSMQHAARNREHATENTQHATDKVALPPSHSTQAIAKLRSMPQARTHTHARTHARTHIPTCLPPYIINTYVHTHIHTCMHACMHTHLPSYMHAYRTHAAPVRQRARRARCNTRHGSRPSMQLRSSRAKSYKTKPRTLCFALRFRRPPCCLLAINRMPHVGIWAAARCLRRVACTVAVACGVLPDAPRGTLRPRAPPAIAPIGACAEAAALRCSVVGPRRAAAELAPQTMAQNQSSFGRPPAPCR